MVNFKVVISDPKGKKAYQKEVDQRQTGFIGKKIGEHVSGEFIGLPGYKVEITGGSDKQGFPMRKDVSGTARKKLLLAYPPGYHTKVKGVRKRRSVRGNTVSEETSQVNVKIVGYGTRPVTELLGVKEKPKEEKPAEKTEEKKPETKEAPKETPKEEKPKEEKPIEKKEEPKKEEKPKEKDTKKAEEKMGVKSLEEVEEKAEKKSKEEK